MKKNVTAKDIANLCGVSQATVSYVINNRTNEKISEETRKKVLNAIEELHYVPNAAARNMRKKSCASIGIVCAKDYSRQAFLNSLAGISSYLDEIDYTITIFNEEAEKKGADTTPQYVKSYYSDLIDGLIYISNNNHNDFIGPAIKNNIPYVVICMDGVFSKNSPVPHAFDAALSECALFCKEHALKRISYFSVEHNGLFVNHKFPVFQKALKEIYPECNLQHVVCSVKEHGAEHMRPFIADYIANHDFDIAISQNYDIGLIIQKEILKTQFQIPQRIKNIFLNYVNFYEITYPSITGVAIPYTEMGEYAARLIVAILSGQEDGFPYEEFHCQVIHRQSTEF